MRIPWTTYFSINQITLNLQCFWAGVVYVDVRQLPVFHSRNSSGVYHWSKSPQGLSSKADDSCLHAVHVCKQQLIPVSDSYSNAVPRHPTLAAFWVTSATNLPMHDCKTFLQTGPLEYFSWSNFSCWVVRLTMIFFFSKWVGFLKAGKEGSAVFSRAVGKYLKSTLRLLCIISLW